MITSKPVWELAILNYIALWHTFKDRCHRVQIKSNILLTQVRISQGALRAEDYASRLLALAFYQTQYLPLYAEACR